MSSEMFEGYEMDLQAHIASVSKKLNAQIPNYTGEQRKAAIRATEKELEQAEQLLREMDGEARIAPAAFRSKLYAKVTAYQDDLGKLRRDLKATMSGSFQADRQALMGDDYDSRSFDQRSRLLDGSERLNRTSDRLANTRRIAQESENIGVEVLAELDEQGNTIRRTGQKLHGTDANLGRSHNILNSMARRIVTSKIIMMSIIFLLIGILGIVVYMKLKKK
eukprot:m.478939 g.478939  ORF g.478939 m.478939 type:complete len:221 (-) comp21281_c0_seq1:224-886(-)